MEPIFITDVAPRDGLQNQPVHLSTADKLQLIGLLAGAGVASVEASSFVSPKAVPQMADAAELLQQLAAAQPSLRASVLVPNLKGLERAVAAGAREIAVVLSITDTMNLKNINMSLEQATAASADTLRQARSLGLATRAYLAVAFECPFEGVTPLPRLRELAAAMLAAGAQEIVVADTIGAAAPAAVRERIDALAEVVPLAQLAIHLHDTRGMALANAWAALEAGVRRFDASAGGIGGCPFAPGAAGNLATEDLVLMAEASGYSTGIDLDGLLAAVEFAETRLQRSLGGGASRWLRRQRERRQAAAHAKGG
ncbi:hydroxymethylglutaryl-CoA lyase [Massilia sp. LXY-6]|uniref:hydroxymethylglutaryl-CoA lyase n=1 Tax=Massilia sp. LXY-6 TaxID=3379823 RepID=UPI003EE32DE4